MENENKIDPKRTEKVAHAFDLAAIELKPEEQEVLNQTLQDGLMEEVFDAIIPHTVDEVMQQVEVSSKFRKKMKRHLRRQGIDIENQE